MRMFGLFAAAFILIGLVISINGQRPFGGYRSISTDDAGVVAAAEFAVGKRGEMAEQEGLKLASIENAEIQSASGSNYRLCLTVSLSDDTQSVRAVVHRNLKQDHTLTSWEVVEGCSPAETRGVRALKSSPPPSLRKCVGSQLTLREAQGDADIGGKRYANFVFENTSTGPCSLSGYPRFAVLNKNGEVIRSVGVAYDHVIPGEEMEEGRKSPPPTVTLGPGQTAWFQIFYNDGMALPRRKPYPVYAEVRISAPSDKRAFVLKSSMQICCGIQVSSVRAGLPH